ncbi:hypothetical protein ID866_5831, partial [Astraeus odoratus]
MGYPWICMKGVLERLAEEGERGLPELENIREMNELSLDAKASARSIGPDGRFDGGRYP